MPLPKEFQGLFNKWKLSESRFFRTYRSHAYKVLKRLYPDEEDAVEHAIYHRRRTKVAKAIKLTRGDEELEELREKVPLDVRPYLPGMLCPHTSLALVGMSPLDKAARLDNAIFRLAMLQKLHLLLWDSPPARACLCGKEINVYGDHFFTCEKTHKEAASNQICNVLHLILEEVGPLSGLCFSRDDMCLEAQNLSLQFPRKRPEDVAAAMRQHHRSNSKRSPFHTYGTDVNLLKFCLLSHCDDYDNEIAQAISRHQYKERLKLKGKMKLDLFLQQKVAAEEYVADLMDNSVMLSAFTVCPLVLIGPLGMALLYGLPHPGAPRGSQALKPNAARAFEAVTGPHPPRNMVGKANAEWIVARVKALFFGRTYHLATPAAWAEQVLGLNVTVALANLLRTGIRQSVVGMP